MKKLFTFLLLIFYLIMMPSSTIAALIGGHSFDGTDDEIDMGTVLNVTTGNVSVCIWAKTTEDASADIYAGKKQSTATNVAGYDLDQTTADVTRWHISDGVDSGQSTDPTDRDGVWAMFCGTWNGSTNQSTLYTNAVQVDQDTIANVDSITNTQEYSIGESGAEGDDFTGLQAYNQVFMSVLTVDQITELRFKPEGIAGSAGLWTLTWTTATEIDISGKGLVGAVLNSTTTTDGPPVMLGGGLPL